MIKEYATGLGNRIGRGNLSIRRKSAPVPLCPPQIPNNLTLDQTRAGAMGSQQLTAWVIARSYSLPIRGPESKENHRKRHDSGILINAQSQSLLYVDVKPVWMFFPRGRNLPLVWPHIKYSSTRVRVRVTLRLAVYRQSVRLGAEPLETHGQNFFSIKHLRS
jgi:hypothetical protein